MDYYSVLYTLINHALKVTEHKSFVEYHLNFNIPVFSKQQLEDRISSYGDNSRARTLDYSEKIGSNKIRIYDRDTNVIKVRFGKRVLDVDYFYCSYEYQACAYN